jgi:SNF2 family DNA or RNA helicase
MEDKEITMKFFVPPMSHQLEAMKKSLTQKNMFLQWEMGTGKTATAVNMARLQYDGRVKKTLIVAPKAVLPNWKKEYLLHSELRPQDISVLNQQSNHTKHKKIQNQIAKEPNHVFVINHAGIINKDILQTLLKWGPEIVVFDESHRLKSHTTKQSKNSYQLAKCANHIYLLTGSPIINSIEDIWMQFKIFEANYMEKTFGHKIGDFRAHFMTPVKFEHFVKWVPRNKKKIKEVGEFMDPWVSKVKKEECLDLPPLTKQIRYCELKGDQKKAYKEMRDEFISYVKHPGEEDKAIVATLALTKALRLQQIISGHATTDNGEIHTFEDNSRLKVLEETLEEILAQGSKAVVWAHFKHDQNSIIQMLEANGIEHLVYTGERKDDLTAFQQNLKNVIVGSQKSLGTGVDGLQVAPYSIYYSRSYSLEDDLQSEARTYRKGSEVHDKVTRIDIVAKDTIDEKILEALKNKQNIADLILDWDL